MVIENEFADSLGVETQLVKSGVDGRDLSGFFELANGCICCSVKDSLVATLELIVKEFVSQGGVDCIIIECSGLAHPGPIVELFWIDEELESSLKIDGVITMVDAVNIQKYMKEEVHGDGEARGRHTNNHHNTDDQEGREEVTSSSSSSSSSSQPSIETKEEVERQLAFADRILINKMDLFEEMISSKTIASDQGRNQEREEEDQEEEESHALQVVSSYSLDDIQHYLHTLNPFAEIHCTCYAQIDLACILDIGGYDKESVYRHVLQKQANDAHEHEHSLTFTSQAIEFEGIVNEKKVEDLLGRLLWHQLQSQESQESQQPFIARIKGIVWTSPSTLKAVQCVHELWEIEPLALPPSAWPERKNRIILIGEFLTDKQDMQMWWEECLEKDTHKEDSTSV